VFVFNCHRVAIRVNKNIRIFWRLEPDTQVKSREIPLSGDVSLPKVVRHFEVSIADERPGAVEE
jgi:hypothetical protein